MLLWTAVLRRLPLKANGADSRSLWGAFFTLAPPRGALVLAVDLKLVPPLVPLLGGGMIARGVLVIASTSSLTNSLLGITLARVSAPSRLYVEQEAV